ncbi:MAG: oxidoreductase, partial [Gammaproteobacteria bacterium]|nr:oxidoreductase [Gammaproteobacteria bacterium]
GPFWGARLGRTRLRGRQASARGGCVDVEMHDDRVRLRGRAVTVLKGSLDV